MYPTDASVSKNVFSLLDRRGDFISRFDVIDLDIDNAQPNVNPRIDHLERFKIGVWAMCKLKDQVVGM